MTALDKKLIAKVLAARKKWAPRTRQHKDEHQAFLLRGYGAEGWREFAQTQLGLARHPVTAGEWFNVPNGSIRKCLDAVGDFDHQTWPVVSARCLEAFFDGYSLGSVVHGHRGKARVFSSGQQLARFETQSMVAAPALVEALGPQLDSLLAGGLRALPEATREAAAVAMRLAVAMGLLLHQHEFGWKGAWSEVAANVATSQRAQTRAEPAPVHLPENEQMLAAVLAAPDDDRPRLVYADWLMERGDPRGEFIALQLKLGRTLSGAQGRYASASGLKEAEVMKLKQRELELIKRYEKVWVPRERCFRTWAWRRGFLCSVVADLATFASQVGTVARMPLESARLTGFKPEHVKTVMAGRAHPTLRFFDLSLNRLNARTIDVLGARLFSGARGLDLAVNDFSTAATAQALATLELPALERLSVCTTKLTDEGLARLAEAPFFARLTHLDVSFNRALTFDGLQALRKARSLRWVNVLGAEAGDRARLSRLLPRGALVQLSPEDPSVDLAKF